MLFSYLRTTSRTLLKKPLFTCINVAGLSIGIASAMLIFFYVSNELSFDRFHTHAPNLYRINSLQENSGEMNLVATTPPPLAAALRRDLPEIVSTARVGRWYANFKKDTAVFEEKRIYAADPAFLSMFTFPIRQGNKSSALNSPDAILLTEATAEKYFGDNWQQQNIIGKVLKAKAGATEFAFTIQGVLNNPPANSSLQFDMLVPFTFLEEFDQARDQWGYNSYYTYLQTSGVLPADVLTKKVDAQFKRYRPNSSTQLQVQRFTDIYLHSNFDFNSELITPGNLTYVRIFIVTGVIILLLACINFVNLSTARSLKRSKEVGLRKTVGASRLQLIFHFLGEASILCVLAMIAALFLVELLFPLFTALYGKEIQRAYNWHFSLSAFMLYLLLVVLAGLYPAFYLSSFQPIKVLQGVAQAPRTLRFRQAMMLVQFSLSVIMIIAALVIGRQLRFIQTTDLGFERSHLMYLRLKSPDVKKNYQVLKTDIQQQADVAAVSATTANLIDVSNGTNGIKWEGMRPDEDFLMTQMTVDADFIKTTGMQVIQGRGFSRSIVSDSDAFLINETAARRMGLLSGGIGKRMTFWGNEGTVIGVVKDFHFQPLTTSIQPIVLRYRPDEWHFNLLIKTKPNKAGTTIAAIEKLYKKYDQESVLEYGFVDQGIDALYKAQQGAGRIINCFTVLTILLSCLGLFGLAAYTAEQRTKEIGIRKVLGASVSTIIAMLSKDFLKLVALSVLIAAPVAAYFMQGWLQDFAYRITLSWWLFVTAGALAIVIALATTVFHAVKVAVANPVKSLRTE
jgi:ABC-type antimicrobial peptide transport system permease subunit